MFKTESQLLTNMFLDYIATSLRQYKLTGTDRYFYFCGEMHGVEKREQKKKGWVHWKCLSTMEDFDRTYKRH